MLDKHFNFAQTSVFVSRIQCQGLGLET